MNDYRQNINNNIDMFQEALTNISSHIPAILGFLLYLIVAFLSYKVLVFLLIKLLDSLHIERLFPDKLSSKIDVDPTVILLGFFRFGLLLVLFILGAEILGLQVITQELGVLLAFLPRFLMAIAFFVLGLSVSKTITRVVFSLLDAMGLSGARIISRLAGFVILFVIGVMAMELVGIDTAIITTNISIILGALMICVAIAIGLGSVEIVKRILFGFYLERIFRLDK
jgi:hypothetical protein